MKMMAQCGLILLPLFWAITAQQENSLSLEDEDKVYLSQNKEEQSNHHQDLKSLSQGRLDDKTWQLGENFTQTSIEEVYTHPSNKVTDNISLNESSATLSLYLLGVANEELATPTLQSVLDISSYRQTEYPNDTSTVRQIASQLRRKVEQYSEMVTNMKTLVEEVHFWSPPPQLPSCCSLPPGQFKMDLRYGVPIQPRISCHPSLTSSQLYFSSSVPFSQSPSNISQLFQHNLASSPGVKWQHLLTLTGDHDILHPALLTSPNSCIPMSQARTVLHTLHPHTKNVVIVLDQSSNLSSHQFKLGVATAKWLVSSLSPGDRLAIVLLANEARVMDVTSSCGIGRLVTNSPRIQTNILSSLESLVQFRTLRSNLQLGLSSAFKILRHSNHRDTDHGQVVIISNMRDKQVSNILPLLPSFHGMVVGKVVLSVVLLYDIIPPVDLLVSLTQPDGRIHLVNSSVSIGPSLGDWYTVSTPSPRSVPVIMAPYIDELTGGTIVTFSQPVYLLNQIMGVVAVDVHLEELIEDIMFRPSDTQSQKMFLIDETGHLIVHPDQPVSAAIERQSFDSILEPDIEFHTAKDRIISIPSGQMEVDNKTYTWHKVKSSPYIVVITNNAIYPDHRLELEHVTVASESFQYHGHILAGTSKLCRHMREVASMQTSALYLAPSAFASPFDELYEGSHGLRTQSYMAYLTDPTRLIANPGLKVGVRTDTALLAQLTSHWKEHAYSSPLNNYIVRRRAATPRGVQLSYPGSPVSTSTDPTTSAWYRSAVDLPNLLVVGAPHLDPGGAGYVVTVSQAVHQLNSSSDDTLVSAVVSADFTLGFFHKIVYDTVENDLCRQKDVLCFLIDHRGYLVDHPHLSERLVKHIGELHITHMEDLVATDLLTHQNFMKKRLCRHHENHSLQRYFTLDLEQKEIVGDLGSCSQYRLSQVDGTNLFLGMINQTSGENCQRTSVHCWCSTVDRTCLDCLHMEQEECECPCQCEDRGQCDVSPMQVPICPPDPLLPSLVPRYSSVRVDHLPPCIHTDCQSLQHQSDCYGVLGCSWCHSDQDGVSNISSPFCSHQATCYNGILGSPSPYSLLRDNFANSELIDNENDRSLFRASPIGPVAGGIMAFFLLLALTAWGYRHWSGSQHVSPISSRLEEDPVDISSHQEVQSSGHQNYGLNGDISVVSPYRMNPSYRRPGPATDSDHGYSTMTPFGDQDSEIMSCLGDPASSSVRRFKTINPLSLQSVTSGVSSRASSPPLSDKDHVTIDKISEKQNLISDSSEDAADVSKGLTKINKNQIIVAATVHMVDPVI